MIEESSQQGDVCCQPQHLYSPPVGVDKIEGPVDTRHQELPLENLTWENFEKLCFRLAGEEGEAEDWQCYGRRGQAQHGIDIYIRRKDCAYEVWQCKRYQDYSVSDLDKAVSKYFEDTWKEDAPYFSIYVACSTSDTSLQVAIEEHARILKKDGIEFHVLGKEKISEKLKLFPELVDDFFGRHWVKSFCGEDALELLKANGRILDGRDVELLRSELYEFYHNHFSSLDRGLVGAVNVLSDDATPLPLMDRFIIPDILVNETVYSDDPIDHEEDGGKRTENKNEYGFSPISARSGGAPRVETYRKNLGDWLCCDTPSVVLGDAGSGKSTLLRCIALDLLSNSPKMHDLSKIWGDYLPILIPFARWTRMVAASSSPVPLEKMIEAWLEVFSVSARLQELVLSSLEDKRLLLLVDGLDEWVDEESARTVFHLLETVIKTKKISTVFSGRPLGAKKLTNFESSWHVAELAPFSDLQQRSLAKIWFTSQSKRIVASRWMETATHESLIDSEVDNFFSDLEQGQNLKNISGNALILTGLISLRIGSYQLPRNRFRVYEELTKIFLEIHPQGRAKASADTCCRFKVVKDVELRQRVLGKLAYEIHRRGADSGFSRDEAIREIRNYLKDEDVAGFSSEKANEGAKEILSVNAEVSSVLVEKAPEEIGFIHAVFEEYLTSVHLAEWPLSDVKELIRAKCIDPRWQDVILALFKLLNRPAEVDSLIHEVEHAEMANVYDEYLKMELLAKAAFGDSKRSHRLANEIAQQISVFIETGSYMPVRESLLKVMLDETSSESHADFVRDNICSWIFDFPFSTKSVFKAMESWPEDYRVKGILWRGIFSEEQNIRLAAGETLVSLFKEDESLGHAIIEELYKPHSDSVLSDLLLIVSKGWPSSDFLSQIIRETKKSYSEQLKLVGAIAAVRTGVHDDYDRELLCGYLKDYAPWKFALKDVVFDSLCLGWANNEVVFKECIGLLDVDEPSSSWNSIIARDILFKNYSDREEVQKYFESTLEKSLAKEQHSLDIFDINFSRVNPSVDFIGKVEEWMTAVSLRRQDADYHLAIGASFTKSDRAKDILLERLCFPNELSFHVVGKLLEIWGNDDDVQNALLLFSTGSLNEIQYIGHYLPSILKDRECARQKLIELAKFEGLKRPDLIMQGFVAINADSFDTEILNCMLPFLKSDELYAPIGTIIDTFCEAEEVKNYVQEMKSQPDLLFRLLTKTHLNDPDVRSLILNRIVPLPANLRKIIIAKCERQNRNDEYIDRILRDYAQLYNSEVRSQAEFYEYKNQRKHDDYRNQIDNLIKEVQYCGDRVSSIRQAAFAGMIASGNINLMHEIKEKFNSDSPVTIRFSDAYENNQFVMDIVAKHWGEIKKELGKECYNLLGGVGDNPQDLFFQKIAPKVKLSKVLEDDFVEWCKAGEKNHSSQSLQALSRLDRARDVLYQECKKAFVMPNVSQFVHGAESLKLEAASILANQFGDDSSLQSFFEECLANSAFPLIFHQLNSREYICSGAVLGLAVGWPESKALDDVIEKLKEHKEYFLLYPGAIHLVSARYDLDRASRVIQSMVQNTDNDMWLFLPKVIGPMVKLISENDALYDHLFLVLKDSEHPNERASLPRLLAMARSGDSQLRDWCNEQLSQMMGRRELHEFGFDIVDAKIRPVSEALYDVVNYSLH